jgi:hypothetical protein
LERAPELPGPQIEQNELVKELKTPNWTLPDLKSSFY